MLRRHCLKDVAPAPHKVPGFFAARYLFAMCGLPATEQFASVLKSANLPPTHVASNRNTRDIFVAARSNAATSGSRSVQMTIIVSLHKIAKQAPVIFHRAPNLHCFLALTGISSKLISLRLRPTPFMVGLKCAPVSFCHARNE